ncbi:PepSY domain-containing protein [Candidatus Bipolaricaulota bacterium]|nr:PepSY domain-containing protein [Candidatus Bipolaricaulota bacterium]
MDSGQMMGGRNSAGNMMGGMRGYYSDTPTPIPHDDAREIAEDYLKSLNNSELEIGEFEEYSHNYYVSLVEKDSGRRAFEILIDRYTRSYRPEPQSMAWNGKYGTMGGGMMMRGKMRGRSNNQGMMGGPSSTEMNISSVEAMEIARDFLDVVYPGTEADEVLAYYGYYTVMTTKDGEHYGMLSVNGYSGDVWYHTWHGSFISEVNEH